MQNAPCKSRKCKTDGGHKMAISLKKIKLKSIVECNTTWPLVIGGVSARDFDGPRMPATISPRDLNDGRWVQELCQMGVGMTRLVMVIDGLDEIGPRAQEKFIRLLKDRRAGIYKLPDNVQIIMPVKSVARVSPVLCKLSIIYNV